MSTKELKSIQTIGTYTELKALLLILFLEIMFKALITCIMPSKEKEEKTFLAC